MQTITASELQRHPSIAVDRVRFERTGLVILRHGRPVAVLLSVEDLKLLEAKAEQREKR
jgi:prevent-host-death family protein